MNDEWWDDSPMYSSPEEELLAMAAQVRMASNELFDRLRTVEEF